MRHTRPFVILYERLIERQAVERATRVALGNSQSKGHYLSRYEDQRPDKFVEVPIGVNLEELQDRPRSNPLSHLSMTSADRVILFVGRLYPEKNPALFIGACDLLHQQGQTFDAVIIGDGIQSDLVRESMAKREWLHWIPKLNRSEALDAIALSRVLVITSRYESSPLVLLEAIGLGIPVVSTPVGRALELIEEGVGRVVPTNPNGVADAIRKVLSWNSEDVKTACLRLKHRIDFDTTMSDLIRLLRDAGPGFTGRVARHGPSTEIA
jgi:glycosyltransferase involved in cell wall biosynthesis